MPDGLCRSRWLGQQLFRSAAVPRLAAGRFAVTAVFATGVLHLAIYSFRVGVHHVVLARRTVGEATLQPVPANAAPRVAIVPELDAHVVIFWSIQLVGPVGREDLKHPVGIQDNGPDAQIDWEMHLGAAQENYSIANRGAAKGLLGTECCVSTAQVQVSAP